jgi:hypothetical protein
VSGLSSCAKCGSLLAVASVGGLCPRCAPAAEPATRSFPDVAPPAADTPNAAADPTPASAARPDPHAPTHTAPDAALTLSGPSAPPAKAEKPRPPDPTGYTLFERIGEGGMGEVFRAHEHSTDQFVALKMIDPKRLGDTSFERFQREYRALANFQHPHAVRGLKDRLDHVPPFFTMELVQGCTVADRLKTVKRYDPTEAVQLIRKVALAVQALHDHKEFGHPSAGAIHRDIKPSNILLTESGEPKLADFGLVKYLDAATLTSPDAVLGTPAYMPPEQCAGRSAAMGYAADVYGLGATLYHMLTGEPPFRGTVAEIIAQVLTVDPRPVCEVASEVPAALGKIVRSCMFKRAGDRYRTVSALIADLDLWLKGLEPIPPEPSRATRLLRWAKANAVALSACALLALSGAAAAAWPKRDAQPIEPLLAIRGELKGEAGRAELIGATGRPRHERWLAGTASVLEPTAARPGFAFEAPQATLLELLNEPGANVAMGGEFQLLYHKAIVNAGAGPKEVLFSDAAMFGLYCGCVELNGPNTSKAHFVLVAEYTDYATPEVRNARPNFTGSARFVWVAVTADANGVTNSTNRSAGKQHKFSLVATLPTPPRRLRVELTAEGATAFWADSPHGALVPVGKRSATEIANDLAELLKTKPGFKPVGRLVWNPSASCGVFCRGAAISVTNVTVSAIR